MKTIFKKILLLWIVSMIFIKNEATMPKNAKIYLAGHNGLVGRALMRELKKQGYSNIITREFKELDLRRQKDVENFFFQEKPEFVLLAAAKVGGIWANMSSPADFIYDNLIIECNVISAAKNAGV